MTARRRRAHEEIDRMTEGEVHGLLDLLATYPDPVGAALRNALLEDAPESEKDRAAATEALEWLEANGGRGIPHDEVMRELGIK